MKTMRSRFLALLVMLCLPLAALGAKRESSSLARWRVALYFLALGFGFIFIEISFIQGFTLFLGHPLAAIAVVLAAFLIFAGLGSGASARLAERWRAPLAVAARIAIANKPFHCRLAIKSSARIAAIGLTSSAKPSQKPLRRAQLAFAASSVSAVIRKLVWAKKSVDALECKVATRARVTARPSHVRRSSNHRQSMATEPARAAH